MKVRQLTTEQKDQLIGQLWNESAYFNPTQDANGNWFISNEEVNGCVKEEFSWVKELAEIDYNPVVTELPN
jgi:K+-transporting ATPase c subunit